MELKSVSMFSLRFSLDKKHMRGMLKIISKVVPQNSLLIFDTGANSKKNQKIPNKFDTYHGLPSGQVQIHGFEQCFTPDFEHFWGFCVEI